ncbi:hypothetical protein GCM10020331_082950 [Ectobacillus funiculus]
MHEAAIITSECDEELWKLYKEKNIYRGCEKMIYTCTLNPSIDYVVELDSIQLGDLNRAKRTEQYPGGKGINVSRVLKRLGVEKYSSWIYRRIYWRIHSRRIK